MQLLNKIHTNYIFSNLIFHNFRTIIFYEQEALSLNVITTSVSLFHHVSTKILIEYLFLEHRYDLFWRQKQPPKVFVKKGILKNFANFT